MTCYLIQRETGSCYENPSNQYAKSERWEKDCGLAFTTSVGTPVECRNVITHFKKVISETGPPNIRFHDLRHTVATLLLSKEINPKIVQEQLGHSSINHTLNMYSHVICGRAKLNSANNGIPPGSS